ncbi:MAG: hypothetical protein ABI866_02015 [Dokdonella sp.]
MSKSSACRSRATRPAALIACGLFAASLHSTAAFANAPIQHYVGTAYDAQGRELYTESHWTSGQPGKEERLILFQCPDGKAFARKHVEDAGHAQTPLFELDDSRVGYREGVRLAANGAREVFVRRNATQSEQTASLESVPGLVVDAGFDRFVLDNWDALVSGQNQKVEFLLPSKLRTYTFELSPTGTDEIDGTPVQRFRLELDAWFGFALPPIDMAYSRDSKSIREYTGVSNIRDNDGKNLKVRIEFPEAGNAGIVDAQSLVQAGATRLDGRCTL